MKFVSCALGAALCVASVAEAGAQTPPAIRQSALNPVPDCATPGRLMAYLRSRNPALDARFAGIAADYMRSGEEFGLRWDFAFFQMIVDTASLTFRRANGQPGVVRLEQNNFAGIGASGGANTGESFADVATGVRAHLQHVLLYSGVRVWAPLAERTRQVRDQGLLAGWQKAAREPIDFAELARHWSPSDPSYGAAIMSVAARYYTGFCAQPDPTSQIARPRLQGPITLASRNDVSNDGAAVARPAEPPARADDVTPRMGIGAATVEPPAEPARQQPALAHVRILNPAPVEMAPPSPEVRELGRPVVVAALPPAPSAPPVNAADESVKTFVAGRTILLDTPLGTTIPIAFSADGTMAGQARSLAGFLGAASDRGRWWVARARLCQRWSVWFDKETQCLKLRQTGRTIHWVRDDGQTGTAKFAN